MLHTPETLPNQDFPGQARGESSPAVLHVGPSPQDWQSLTAISRAAGWHALAVPTMSEALRRVRLAHLPVVISEGDLPDGNWRLLLEDIQNLPDPPYLIVSSRLADERLWAEVLNLGGWDVLSTPFERNEVRHVVAHAWDSWHRERRQTGGPRPRKGASSANNAGALLARKG